MTRYRQIAQRLRLQMGPGRPDIVSERPRHKSGRYLDLDDDGQSTTVIDIPADTLADIPALLRQGAIQEMPQPTPKSGKGATRGEGAS